MLLIICEEKQMIAQIYLLDIRLQDTNGLDLAKHIRTRQPCAKIIFLTAYE